jgi:putative hydrolase of the HAD superfamily
MKSSKGAILTPQMTNLPKAILFDLDETILSFGDRRLLFVEVAEEFAEYLGPISPQETAEGLEAAMTRFWSDEASHKHWRFRLLEARVRIVSDLFAGWQDRAPGLTPEVARRFAERFHSTREDQARFFPGALEAIDELKRRGVLLALVTNGDSAAQRAKIERFDLTSRFDHIQIEGEAGFGKPEPQTYIHAMAVLGVEAHETWMVGDNLEWEVAGPQRLGIYSIWHDHVGRGVPASRGIVPDRIIRSIAELVQAS